MKKVLFLLLVAFEEFVTSLP